MKTTWSARDRSAMLATAAGQIYDLLIIGGGITGAGIARECSLRNISCCILEKDDFASGTSSRSSKLFHGGLRYLASLEVSLVRESTSERNWLRCHLPHLVRPLGFVYPAYERNTSSPLKVRSAIFLYDLISDFFNRYKNYRKSKTLSHSNTLALEPALAKNDSQLGNLLMAGFYYDTYCDDARVTLEIIKESLELSQGRSAALNYTEVEGFVKADGGKVCGARARDVLTGEDYIFRGKCLVTASGVWTDKVLSETEGYENRIYPTKGVHLVVPAKKLGNINAFSLTSLDDKRFFFILRRDNVSLIGTTDTAYSRESGDLDNPRCTREDCEYLLRTVNRFFPDAHLTDDDIISAYAGIRPLIRQGKTRTESDVSRRHVIFKTPEGITAIAGGKSTIHRKMAEDLLLHLEKENLIEPFTDSRYYRKGFSKQPLLVGLSCEEFNQFIETRKITQILDKEQLDHLYHQYGRNSLSIIRRIEKAPPTGKRLIKGVPFCEAEIEYILNHENAPRLIDMLCRRTEAQWTIWHHRQPELAKAVSAIMASFYDWDEKRRDLEIACYLDYVHHNVAFMQN